MSVYLIGEITISDREEYTKYEEGFMDIFLKYEGEILSVDESPVVMDGEWTATRLVLLKFPSAEAAAAWGSSEAYQELSKHRQAAATTRSIMVQGIE